MKIIFVTSSLGFGGAERVISELASEFSKQHQVLVAITSIKQKESYSCGSAAITYLSEASKLSPFQKIHKLEALFKKWSPDVVVAFPDPCSFYAAKAAKRVGIPCICSERNAPRYSPTNPLMRIVRTWSYHLATRVVFQTEQARDYFGKSIQKKGTIISNPFQQRSSLVRKPEEKIISAGRFTPQKNFICLIDAFSLFHVWFPNYSLTIYGEGPERINLENEIHSKGLDSYVFLPGFSDHLESAFASAAIFVMSSDHEGMPNALLEAAAAGLPCVATDCPVGGPRKLIGSNPNDILVPVGDSQAIADALKKIVANYDDVSKGCEGYANQLKESLSIGNIAHQWLSLINSIISNQKKK
ncbi:MAG: GalNAc-alpha-(1-_4)-GalNAc-alpha-(1-_3)-diNAcBac-PP-undecaprenol alpha-1,4-N-acetyl-D-galactosaminyltransferase [bacterium ADurb.BinA186]|nr:MAG: GalNAc-alpha-(1->4)-GalNAc-alpha-(1->3)-diNAcBac-PP-undecaprenol alpha-1,4-N-acetyl-D-galactosaminyltransferase [bacterium ADurb.BinA186]